MTDQPDQPTPAQAAADEAEGAEKSLLEITLAGAIALTKGKPDLAQANEQFAAVLKQVRAKSPAAAPLLEALWSEYTSAQRSATFWQSLSDAEKDLSDKMSETNIQLKQNYMRLIQEQ
ncbi:MAG: hypothetical protein AAFR58_22915 [Cyanobacteria bacterium J06627_28]